MTLERLIIITAVLAGYHRCSCHHFHQSYSSSTLYRTPQLVLLLPLLQLAVHQRQRVQVTQQRH
jgi:hypothetical protein